VVEKSRNDDIDQQEPVSPLNKLFNIDDNACAEFDDAVSEILEQADDEAIELRQPGRKSSKLKL